MSIYDRDYMKDTARPRFIPNQVIATYVLIGINLLVFFLIRSSRDILFFNNHLAVSANNVFRNYHFHTLITSAFTHITFNHLFFNMLTLFFFAPIVERQFGTKRLVILYLLGAIICSLGHITQTAIQGQMGQPAIGASGSVMAIVIVSAFLRPKALVLVFFIPMTLKWLAILYVIFDFIGLFNTASRIAHAGHLGGAVAGLSFFLYYRYLSKKYRLVKVERQRQPQPIEIHIDADEPFENSNKKDDITLDAQTAQKLDQLLIKIKQHGKESLTEEEQDFLIRISEKFRR